MSLDCSSVVENDHTSHDCSSIDLIPKENLKLQGYLEKINTWSEKMQMELNLEKTKLMIINPSKDKQFTVNLQLNGKTIKVVDE